MLMTLFLALNTCGVPWDPVKVLPEEVQPGVAGARLSSPCRVATLPKAVREHLAEKDGDSLVMMADPNQDWNFGCGRLQGIPSRQLVAAARAGRKWVVHYRTGGLGIVETAVVLEETGARIREVWRGRCEDKREESPEAPGKTRVVARECRGE